jgi:hypothetical protein
MSTIQKLISTIWNKEEMPDQWQESFNLKIRRKHCIPDCTNYRGISLLSNSYKIVTSISNCRGLSYMCTTDI